MSTGTFADGAMYDEWGGREALAGVAPSAVSCRHYTGKEDQWPDFTVPYTDFGARHYSPALRRWLTPDPLSEKYYTSSPYAYCADNPINLVDPDGRRVDDYLFDKNLDYTGIIKTGANHRIVIETTNGKMIINFADSVNDPKAIESGIIKHIAFVNDETIQQMIDSQGGFNASVFDFVGGSSQFSNIDDRFTTLNSYDYAASELSVRWQASIIDGEMISEYLFVTEGENLAHNIMNYGNYLWGATGYAVGLNTPLLILGANVHRLYETTVYPILNNRQPHPELDSKDDKQSIKAGIAHAKRFKYRKK